MMYELTADELAAQEVLVLPERELLEPITIVAPTQIVAAANLAFIETDDVGGDVLVGQANCVYAEQDTYAEIDNY